MQNNKFFLKLTLRPLSKQANMVVWKWERSGIMRNILRLGVLNIYHIVELK